MALTRSYKQTITERAQGDPEFAQCMLQEVATLFHSGEAQVAEIMLRNLIDAMLELEETAQTHTNPNPAT